MAQTQITQEMIDSHLADVLHHGEPKDVFFYLRFVENPNVPLVNPRFNTERLPVWSVMSGEHMHVNTAALLKLHPDVNVRNESGQNPAMKAFEKKHAGLGLMFLRAGTDLTARDSNGSGLLKYVVDAGYPDAVQEAIHIGLDVNQTNIEQTLDANGVVVGRYVSGALAWAIANENWDVLKVLVENGIDRNPENPAVRQAMKVAESHAQISPLLRAELGPEKYKAMLEAAQQKSADFMRVITDGVFPEKDGFDGAGKVEETFQKRLALLPPELQEKVLLETGIMRAGDIGGSEEKRRQMFTPISSDEKLIYPRNLPIQKILDDVLLNDIKYGEAKDVYMWLKLGANPNAAEEKGGKPALFAAVEENLYEMKIAQKREEIIRTAKYNGIEPVIGDNLADEFVEFKDGPYQKVKYLLDFGADPDTVHPIQKMSVIERAYGKGRLGVVQLLKKRGAHTVNGLLTFTAQMGEAQDVEDLFKEYTLTNADGQKEAKVLLTPEQIKKEGIEALKIAIERDKPRMVNVFKEQGLVPSAESKEGKDVWAMARGKDKSMVLSALKGHYFIQPESQKHLTLEEKIAELSDADLRRLTVMAAGHETVRPAAEREVSLSQGSVVVSEKSGASIGKPVVPTHLKRPQKPVQSDKQGAVRRAWGMLRRLGRH